METPYSIAWNGWANGTIGRRCADDSILRSSEFQKLLHNRLKEAFEAGWNARESSPNPTPASQEP